MTRPAACRRCSRPTGDTAYICHDCGSRLAHDLHSAADVAAEMDVTIARLCRQSGGIRRRSTEIALPFSWGAADAAWTVRSTLAIWADHVTTGSGRPGPTPRRPANLARWLADQTGWLRHRPEADQAYDELTYAAHLCIRVVDLPRDRWYAGPCQCGTDLYAAAAARTVTCRHCGTRHDADARRQWLLAQAEDQLATAAAVAAAVTTLGVPLRSDTVRQWACRGRIAAHGTDRRGRPTYRVGDVLAAARHATER